MEIEIAPEAATDVRRAIVAALAEPAAERPESAWWRAGIAEAVGADDDDR